MSDEEITQTEETPKEEKIIKPINLDKTFLMDSHQCIALAQVSYDFFETSGEAYGYTHKKVNEFQGVFDSKGKLTAYKINGSDNSYAKEYFENYKKFEKIFSKTTLIYFSEGKPLIILLDDCEVRDGEGITAYFIAPKINSGRY